MFNRKRKRVVASPVAWSPPARNHRCSAATICAWLLAIRIEVYQTTEYRHKQQRHNQMKRLRVAINVNGRNFMNSLVTSGQNSNGANAANVVAVDAVIGHAHTFRCISVSGFSSFTLCIRLSANSVTTIAPSTNIPTRHDQWEQHHDVYGCPQIPIELVTPWGMILELKFRPIMRSSQHQEWRWSTDHH